MIGTNAVVAMKRHTTKGLAKQTKLQKGTMLLQVVAEVPVMALVVAEVPVVALVVVEVPVMALAVAEVPVVALVVVLAVVLVVVLGSVAMESHQPPIKRHLTVDSVSERVQ